MDLRELKANDCYYTSPAAAAACLDFLYRHIDRNSMSRWLEPAAGAGAFYGLLPDPKTGLDLHPQHPAVMQADFLAWDPPAEFGNSTITVGNPPFGKNSSLAVKFFNHAAEFSACIAMILPRTFKKFSVTNRLHPNFHLLAETDLPENSFRLAGEPYDVPCVFQVWQRRDGLRDIVTRPAAHPDFRFTGPEAADFAVQRVGAGAGRVKDVGNVSPNSHYFIKAHVPGVRAAFERIRWDSVKFSTAGNPSIAKPEVAALYAQFRET